VSSAGKRNARCQGAHRAQKYRARFVCFTVSQCVSSLNNHDLSPLFVTCWLCTHRSALFRHLYSANFLRRRQNISAQRASTIGISIFCSPRHKITSSAGFSRDISSSVSHPLSFKIVESCTLCSHVNKYINLTIYVPMVYKSQSNNMHTRTALQNSEHNKKDNTKNEHS